MTPQQIKEQIERAAESHSGWITEQDSFSQGATHVLEHPELYGLVQLDREEKQLLIDTLNSACAHVRYYNDKDKSIHSDLKLLVNKISGGK